MPLDGEDISPDMILHKLCAKLGEAFERFDKKAPKGLPKGRYGLRSLEEILAERVRAKKRIAAVVKADPNKINIQVAKEAKCGPDLVRRVRMSMGLPSSPSRQVVSVYAKIQRLAESEPEISSAEIAERLSCTVRYANEIRKRHAKAQSSASPRAKTKGKKPCSESTGETPH